MYHYASCTCSVLKPQLLCKCMLASYPDLLPLNYGRSGVFGDVSITSGGHDLLECTFLGNHARSTYRILAVLGLGARLNACMKVAVYMYMYIEFECYCKRNYFQMA